MDGLNILKGVSRGSISIVEAVAQLKLSDAGHVLDALKAENLALPQLSDAEINRQATESLQALRECLK